MARQRRKKPGSDELVKTEVETTEAVETVEQLEDVSDTPEISAKELVGLEDLTSTEIEAAINENENELKLLEDKECQTPKPDSKKLEENEIKQSQNLSQNSSQSKSEPKTERNVHKVKPTEPKKDQSVVSTQNARIQVDPYLEESEKEPVKKEPKVRKVQPKKVGPAGNKPDTGIRSTIGLFYR